MNNTRGSKPTRAELVRQRQNTRSQQRVSSPPKSNAQNRRSTPISTRGVVNGFNYVPPVQQRVRKQYYYSVGARNTEIRMPAVPSIKIGWRLLSFVLLILAVVGLYYAFNAPFLQVKTYQLNGLVRVTSADIDAELRLLDKSIVYANPQAAVKKIGAAFPELYNLRFEIKLPNQIIISAVERQPVMGWQTEDILYWIDNEGVLIEPRGEAPEMLVIQANEDPIIQLNYFEMSAAEKTNNSEENENSRENNSTMVTEIPNAPQWGNQIDPVTIRAAYQLQSKIPAGTPIIFDRQHGMGWRAQQGWDVFIGLTLNDIEYKLKAYEVLINKLNNEGVTPSMISIEYAQAPYYRE